MVDNIVYDVWMPGFVPRVLVTSVARFSIVDRVVQSCWKFQVIGFVVGDDMGRAEVLELLEVVESTRFDEMPRESRDRVTHIENRAIDYHPGRRSQTQDLGSYFVYYDRWRRVKVSVRIALERPAAVRQVPDDLPSSWEHNEAGSRDPRDVSRDFDPNDLTRPREDRVTPATMSEVEQPEHIQDPS